MPVHRLTASLLMRGFRRPAQAERSQRTAVKRLKTVLAAVALLSGAAAAAAQARELGRAAGAVTGIAAGIYVHELGHATAFWLQGATDIRIQVPGEHCRLLCGSTHARFEQPLTPRQQQWASTAGLLASNLVAEALLARRSLARSSVGQGLIAGNEASNLLHVYGYYTRRVGEDGYRGNDLDQFEAAGGNPHLLGAVLVAQSLYAAKRMRDRQIPLLFVKLRF